MLITGLHVPSNSVNVAVEENKQASIYPDSINQGLGIKYGLQTEYKTRTRYKTWTTDYVYKHRHVKHAGAILNASV